MVIAYIAAIIYSCLLGVYDAIMYGRKGADSFEWNEHIILVMIRGCFPVALQLGIEMTTHQVIFIGACFVFLYSFFHNGCYYVTRAAMDGKIYPWRSWTAASSTDTSLVHFRYWPRTIQFLISLIAITYYLWK